MPAKATLYNLKCEPVFDFGTGPRNVAYFNPQGNILCLAGFGNLHGNMELWDLKGKKLISNPNASDSTYFEWCPDGEHMLTATTAPRLRVNNGYVHPVFTPLYPSISPLYCDYVNNGYAPPVFTPLCPSISPLYCDCQ